MIVQPMLGSNSSGGGSADYERVDAQLAGMGGSIEIHYMRPNQMWATSKVTSSSEFSCYKNSAVIRSYAFSPVLPGESPYGLSVSIEDGVMILREKKYASDGIVE